MTVAYRFGRFELRPAMRQLLVDEQPATLGARAFDLLLALVERRDRLVGKDELLDLVWPGLVVEENNLQVQVSALRKLLGQDAIATVAGHGYRFTLEPAEVVAAGVSPPPVTKHNLPAQVASFIGRARELTDLRAVLSRHRLATLTGVGGIGKTRLALALGSLVAGEHADGVWFVDLAPVSDSGQVVNAVASALAVREEPGRPVIETVLKFVNGRSLLLLLDNCEHLLQACAQLTRDLLQAGQKLTIVATSREPLHVAGEATFPLPTLATPDPRHELPLDTLGEYAGVQLFVDRAIAARRDFALTQQNAAAVTRICHDLDGIPLAIELAAARMRAMSAETIADHLTDRFRLLKSGDATVLPRQQTLRATIDWSYDLLSPAERTLLHRLSVFAGGFALEGAEAVGSGEGVAAVDVLELLSQLVDKSLVAFDAPGDRYKLLETVRQYAQERLAESSEEEATRDRHLRFHVALAQRAAPHLNGPMQPGWIARLDAERENIVLAFAHAQTATGGAALALSMVHGLYMWLTWKDAQLWHRVILDVLAHPDAQQEDPARSYALSVAGFVAYLDGCYEEAFALGQNGVRIARACGDASALAEGHYTAGLAAVAIDRQADAREHLLEGLAVARQTGNRVVIANTSCGLGELYSQQGEFELAESAYLEALSYSRDDPNAHLIVLHNLARNAIALHAEGKAVQFLRDAVAADSPTHHVAWVLLMNCAGVAALREDWGLALRLTGAARAHQERQSLWGDFVDAPFHARYVAQAREALGAIAADAALATGRATSFDAMIQEAETWIQSLPNT